MNSTKQNNNLGDFYTNLGKTANTQLNSIYKATNTAVNNVRNTISGISNNTPNTVKTNSIFNFFSKKNNVIPNTSNNSVNTGAMVYAWPIFLFIIITVLTIVIVVRYKDKIMAGLNNINQRIRGQFNKPQDVVVDASEPPETSVTDYPSSPQQDKLDSQTKKKTGSIIDKLLPMGNPEVFNISKNEFSYYDAEPLCRALGAQLATYDQVKEAWSKGADWCNYGWVKGQAAVYPTQEDTYKKIQSGPEEDRNSCGTVGINGGYFENPEMKFGVSCYGVKPPQSEHDEEVLMKSGQIPKTVPGLAVDKKVHEFKKITDHLGVLPFNEEKWSTL